MSVNGLKMLDNPPGAEIGGGGGSENVGGKGGEEHGFESWERKVESGMEGKGEGKVVSGGEEGSKEGSGGGGKARKIGNGALVNKGFKSTEVEKRGRLEGKKAGGVGGGGGRGNSAGSSLGKRSRGNIGEEEREVRELRERLLGPKAEAPKEARWGREREKELKSGQEKMAPVSSLTVGGGPPFVNLQNSDLSLHHLLALQQQQQQLSNTLNTLNLVQASNFLQSMERSETDLEALKKALSSTISPNSNSNLQFNSMNSVSSLIPSYLKNQNLSERHGMMTSTLPSEAEKAKWSANRVQNNNNNSNSFNNMINSYSNYSSFVNNSNNNMNTHYQQSNSINDIILGNNELESFDTKSQCWNLSESEGGVSSGGLPPTTTRQKTDDIKGDEEILEGTAGMTLLDAAMGGGQVALPQLLEIYGGSDFGDTNSTLGPVEGIQNGFFGIPGNGFSINSILGNGLSGNGISGNGTLGNGVLGNAGFGNGMMGNGNMGNGYQGNGVLGNGILENLTSGGAVKEEVWCNSIPQECLGSNGAMPYREVIPQTMGASSTFPSNWGF